ncbi:MAG TPA: winged helix-turn-helix domain-containing protein [Caldilineaceae bacterium]|nr:winged helix-turn-helix domain-containing protein [Caldilineaceae bacterium]
MKRENPFYHRVPIQDSTYFFGRAQEVGRIAALIANGQSVSIIGPRRIGKSSLLSQLCQPLVKAEYGLVADAQTLVYFSGEAWQDQSAGVLYAAIWAAVVDGIAVVGTGAFPADLPAPMVETLDFPTFQRALRQIGYPERRIVLLLDEFDALSHNRHLDEFFFSSLRSLAATQGVVFVTASTQPLLELTYAQQSALSSPFFNIFLPLRLGLLSDDEAHTLLSGTAALGGHALTTQHAGDLLDIAGPHPLFLQIAGYHAWEAIQKDYALDDRTLRQAVAAEAFPHWRYQWRYLSVTEQRTLALLPTMQSPPMTVLQSLQHACLLRAVTQGPVYLSSLLNEFVRQQTVYQVVHFGSLLLDQQNQQAWIEGKLLTLAPQDYRLLALLADQAGQTLSHTELAGQLWPEEQTAINHHDRLKVAISSLRRKLGPQSGIIATDPAGGYYLDPNAVTP